MSNLRKEGIPFPVELCGLQRESARFQHRFTSKRMLHLCLARVRISPGLLMLVFVRACNTTRPLYLDPNMFSSFLVCGVRGFEAIPGYRCILVGAAFRVPVWCGTKNGVGVSSSFDCGCRSRNLFRSVDVFDVRQ